MKKEYLVLPALIFFTACSTPTAPVSNMNTAPIVQTNLNAANTNINTGTSANSNQNTIQSKRSPTVITASHAPEDGYAWEQYNSDRYPVTFLYQNFMKEKFVEKGNTLSNGDSTFMEIGKKLPNESDTDALKRLFFNKLTTEEQENCMISTNAYYSKTENPALRRYEFIPKPDVSANDEMPVEHCSKYGLINGARYFEFQEDKQNFIFMELGQDPWWIDHQTIKILE